MKLVSEVILITISLCAGLCCPNENEDEYKYINIENNSIISIENNTDTFNLNDKINIITIINNEQITQDNVNVFLTDYMNVNENPKLYYSLILFKETNFNTLSKIPIKNENIMTTEGLVTVNEEWIQIENTFNGKDFTSKFSIELLESGTFYIAQSNFGNTNDGKVYINGGGFNKGYITITSNILNSGTNNAYKFTVN
jgi:hypothetical protein